MASPVAPAAARGSRLDFLDWARGIGALIMLQGHVFHSFTATELRSGSPYLLSQFVGGMPPAIFLFLTGVTLAFLLDGLERKGKPPLEILLGGLKRARYLLLLAVAVRLQLWLFSLPQGNFNDVFRVDVLNCMAFTTALLSPLAFFPTRERIHYALFAGLAIAGLAPLASQADLSMLPSIARAWLVPNDINFGLFPWGAFLAFGLCVGSIIRIVAPEDRDRMAQWFAIAGVFLIVSGQYFGNVPWSLYNEVDFWLNSPMLILIKTGVLLWLLTLAWLWTRTQDTANSFVRLLGSHSLFVYWVHIELVYGRWFWYWKDRLGTWQTVSAALGLIALMVALTRWKVKWEGGSSLRLPWFRPASS
jgi:uncharacterized membrane protein